MAKCYNTLVTTKFSQEWFCGLCFWNLCHLKRCVWTNSSPEVLYMGNSKSLFIVEGLVSSVCVRWQHALGKKISKVPVRQWKQFGRDESM